MSPQAIEQSRRAAELGAQGLLKELEEEIGELKNRSAVLSLLTRSEDYVHFLKVRKRRNLSAGRPRSLCQPPYYRGSFPPQTVSLHMLRLAGISWPVRTPADKGLDRSARGVRPDLGGRSQDRRPGRGAGAGRGAEAARKLYVLIVAMSVTPRHTLKPTSVVPASLAQPLLS